MNYLLNLDEMEMITGGCVTGKVNGVITGFCTLGSFLNPVVAVGCAGYGVFELFSCT